MLIQDLFSHTRIYPFEEPQAENESDEQFQRRLFFKPHIEIFNANYFLKNKQSVGAMQFYGSIPNDTMKLEDALKWVEQFNAAFAEAARIAEKMPAENESNNFKRSVL